MMRDVTAVELGKLGQAPGQACCQSALERIPAQLCAQLGFSHDDVLQIDEERERWNTRERVGCRGEQRSTCRFEQVLSRWKLLEELDDIPEFSHLQDDVVPYKKKRRGKGGRNSNTRRRKQ